MPAEPSGSGEDAAARGMPPPTPAERAAAEAARRYRRKRRVIRAGQALMVIGVAVGLVHVLAHLEVFGGQPSALVDLLAGYPAAGALFVVGAILAGQ